MTYSLLESLIREILIRESDAKQGNISDVTFSPDKVDTVGLYYESDEIQSNLWIAGTEAFEANYNSSELEIRFRKKTVKNGEEKDTLFRIPVEITRGDHVTIPVMKGYLNSPTNDIALGAGVVSDIYMISEFTVPTELARWNAQNRFFVDLRVPVFDVLFNTGQWAFKAGGVWREGIGAKKVTGLGMAYAYKIAGKNPENYKVVDEKLDIKALVENRVAEREREKVEAEQRYQDQLARDREWKERKSGKKSASPSTQSSSSSSKAPGRLQNPLYSRQEPTTPPPPPGIIRRKGGSGQNN